MLYQALIITAVIIGSYLIGSLNFAVIISKLKKRDIRKLGSGNPGTMNMFRNFGIPIGFLTMFLDVAKGTVPAIIGWIVVGSIGLGTRTFTSGVFLSAPARLGLYIAGFSVMLGHVFPIFYKFKGGKGIATALGIGFVAQPAIAVFSLAIGIGLLLALRVGSLASFTIISIPIAVEAFMLSTALYDNTFYLRVQYFGPTTAAITLLFSMFMFTIFTHRQNIVKLFQGTESVSNLVGKNRAVKQAKKRQEDWA